MTDLEKNKTKKRVKAWAIWHKYKDVIVAVDFPDSGDFKPTKAMFVDDAQRPMWTGRQYKLIPCTITYEF